jgi:hypothetical protein
MIRGRVDGDMLADGDDVLLHVLNRLPRVALRYANVDGMNPRRRRTLATIRRATRAAGVTYRIAVTTGERASADK